jgi:hypothetical protein
MAWNVRRILRLAGTLEIQQLFPGAHELLTRQFAVAVLVEVLEALLRVVLLGETIAVFLQRLHAVPVLVPGAEGEGAVGGQLGGRGAARESAPAAAEVVARNWRREVMWRSQDATGEKATRYSDAWRGLQ